MKNIKAFLLSKKIVSPDVFHLFFCYEGENLSYIPGQYIILTIPSSPTPLKRLYSLAGSNKNNNEFELIIKLVPDGAASEYIKTLNVGDAVDITGPAGLFAEQGTNNQKIFMTTGTGFAPIRSFLHSTNLSSAPRTLYWGLKNLSEVYLFEELLRLEAEASNFHFTYCLSQQPSLTTIPAHLQHYFRSGHIDVVWSAQNTPINPHDEFYLCGSRIVIETLRTLLLSRGVSKDKLFAEKY